MGEEFFEWILFHPNVKPSCVSSYVVTVLNQESNQKEVLPEMLMDIYVRYIQNYIIKPSDNGGLESAVYSMAYKVLISDTTLRLFIPPQVRKMTPRSRHIYGCEL